MTQKTKKVIRTVNSEASSLLGIPMILLQVVFQTIFNIKEIMMFILFSYSDWEATYLVRTVLFIRFSAQFRCILC